MKIAAVIFSMIGVLAILAALSCGGSEAPAPESPTGSPTAHAGMFSTLPTVEPPGVGDQPPTIQLNTPRPTFTLNQHTRLYRPIRQPRLTRQLHLNRPIRRCLPSYHLILPIPSADVHALSYGGASAYIHALPHGNASAYIHALPDCSATADAHIHAGTHPDPYSHSDLHSHANAPSIYLLPRMGGYSSGLGEAGNDYGHGPDRLDFNPDAPDHPRLSAYLGNQYCILVVGNHPSYMFPYGNIPNSHSVARGMSVGTNGGDLLPGVYEYRGYSGDNRVPYEPNPSQYFTRRCQLHTNYKGYSDPTTEVDLPYGEPFTFRFYEHHGKITMFNCNGGMYRIGD